MKSNLRMPVWLSVTTLPIALYFASFYAVPGEPAYATAYMYITAAGWHALVYGGAMAALGIIMWVRRGGVGLAGFIYLSLLTTLAFIALATDAKVYSIWRFHLNFAMLDLLINGDGQIISFTPETIHSILIEAALVALASTAAVAAALFLNARARVGKPFLLLLLCLVAGNATHASCAVFNITAITQYQSRLPLYRPLTVMSFLIDQGLVSKDRLSNRSVEVTSGGQFNYPRHPLAYNGAGQRLNVLILAVDALRSDMLDQEVMPRLFGYAGSSYRFLDHYSGGNSTRAGIFSLFYGIPASYWQVALYGSRPAALVQAVRDNGYRLGAFASAPLYRPEFHQTVFAGERNLRVESPGETVFERDQSCIDDFASFIDASPDPFLSFIFLDNVHGWAVPEGFPQHFTPAYSEANHMELGPDADPVPFLNLYKNACRYADQNIGKIIDLLEEKGIADRTVVLVTSDHGEEFNDNGLNYWGHNSNFTPAEIKIPLVVHWPGRGSGEVRERSVSYDVSTTLMEDVFGVSNPREDYTVGQNLFDLRPLPFFLSGSYLENAVVERDRIVLIDEMGMLQFKDLSYRDSPNRERGETIMGALRQMSQFVKPEERQEPLP
ncbi:MAG: sulfatase-like hydrolase/transferase [Succinivibrionaceae bacterium]|nr:sulfatase-like hydrolase/transferase [Succinivibrionaceae bacterium]